MEYLGTAILALLFTSFLYFVLDGILAPSEQLLARIDLYSATDEIKRMQKTKHNHDALELLRIGSYNLIHNAPRYNIVNITKLKVKRDHDPEFRRECHERIVILESCEDDNVQKTREKIVRAGDRIVLWNSVSWAILVIPVALVFACLEKVDRAVKALITLPALKLERDFEVTTA